MSLVEVKIGDLGKVITGNTPPKKDPNNYDGTYPFIKPTDMDIDKRYVTEWDENYSEKAYKQYHRSYIPPGATGVVTIGTVGEKLFQAHQYCFTNQSVNVIIPNDKYYDDYVFYLMKLNLPKVESANPGTASGRHHVSKSNFCSIKVDVIESIDSQKRIADILSAYDDLIENNLKRIKLLEQAAQNIYKEWFVNLRFPDYENTPINEETGLPVGWEILPFSEVADFINGYAFKPSHHSKIGLPIIKIKELKNGVNEDTPRNNGDEVKSKYHFGNNTILFSWSASLEVYWWNGGDSLLNQHLFKVMPNAELNKWHFFYGLKGAVEEFRSRANGATMQHIKRSELSTVYYTKPTINFAVDFQKQIEPIRQQVLVLSKQNQKLKAARDILLPRLMNRTIEV